MTTLIALTEEEFDAQFPLVENHLNPHATWAIHGSQGCLFETYGEEFEFVRRQDPAKVWTITDGDDSDWYIVNGLHYVNRVGYLISQNAVPDGMAIEVHIPMATDDPDVAQSTAPADIN